MDSAPLIHKAYERLRAEREERRREAAEKEQAHRREIEQNAGLRAVAMQRLSNDTESKAAAERVAKDRAAEQQEQANRKKLEDMKSQTQETSLSWRQAQEKERDAFKKKLVYDHQKELKRQIKAQARQKNQQEAMSECELRLNKQLLEKDGAAPRGCQRTGALEGCRPSRPFTSTRLARLGSASPVLAFCGARVRSGLSAFCLPNHMYRYLQCALLAGLYSEGLAALRRNSRAQQAQALESEEAQAVEFRKVLAGLLFAVLCLKGLVEHFDVGYHEEIPPQVVDPNIFAETPSAGSKEAWQTYWPGSASVVTNRIGPQPSWQLSNTEYMEPYLVAGENSDGTGGQSKKAARWFDTSVLRYNGMGQPQLPPSGTGARLEEAQALGDSWVQRAVNTSLLCKEAGCTASSKLTVFDPKKEETQRCRLSIHVHPTDYDNQWGQEFIKLWKVNDHMATAMCLPNALGCNASAWRPLIPCLQDLSVDHLLAESGGSLSIQGSINKSFGCIWSFL
eukprot:g33657.t1